MAIVDEIIGIKATVTGGISVHVAIVVIIDASLETTMDGNVDGALVVTTILTQSGTSAMIVLEGKGAICCSTNACSIDSVKSKIKDSIVDEGISSKMERLDNIK